MPLYRLTADPDDLAWLAGHYLTDEYIPAVFAFEEESHAVDVRYRGDISRHFPKKSWKIRFPNGSPFPGRDQINLRADYIDGTMMHTKLATDLFEAGGLRFFFLELRAFQQAYSQSFPSMGGYEL